MDVSFLTPLYDALAPGPGSVASVYLDTTRAAESAAHEIELRWRRARDRLADQGADDRTLAALGEVVGAHEQVPGPSGQAVFAAGGRVLLDRVLPRPPRRQIARWSALPHVFPLVAQAPAVVPHVVVVADRVGGEVRAVGPDRREVDVRHVSGSDQHLSKVGSGGWSHRRIQHTAEETWKANAGRVAEQVEDLVRAVGARVLVAAGDVRAREKLREHLPSRAQEVLVEVEEGGAAAGSDPEALDRALDRVLAEALARADGGVLARFEQERGQRDRAVEGLAATLGALRRAQVDTLVVVDDPSADEQLWIGPEPTLLGTAEQELRDLGVADPVQDRADAALVRAAVGTSAGLLVAASGQVAVEDGIGALLRYSDPATAGVTTP